jgi:hypothetical protein
MSVLSITEATFMNHQQGLFCKACRSRLGTLKKCSSLSAEATNTSNHFLPCLSQASRTFQSTYPCSLTEEQASTPGKQPEASIGSPAHVLNTASIVAVVGHPVRLSETVHIMSVSLSASTTSPKT